MRWLTLRPFHGYSLVASMTAVPFNSNHSSRPDGQFLCLLLLADFRHRSIVSNTVQNLTQSHCTEPHTTSLYRTSHNLTVQNLTQSHCTEPHTISLHRTSHNLTVQNLTPHCTEPHKISLYRTSHNLTVTNLTQSHCTEPHTISLYRTSHHHDSSLHPRNPSYLTAHPSSRHDNKRLVYKNIAFSIMYRNVQSRVFTNAYYKYNKGKVFPVHVKNTYGGVEVYLHWLLTLELGAGVWFSTLRPLYAR
jgi:hypothetical protein